jgi:hypothetical protein
MHVYTQEPEASAVILSDKGRGKIFVEGSDYMLEFQRSVSIKILSNQGFNYADIEIPYYIEDKLKNVKVSIYNLINGEVIETSVSSKEFIHDNSNKYTKVLRVAVPNVGVGSIIEYQYMLVTKYIHTHAPWTFQYEIPVRYSEYTAEYFGFFDYKASMKGDTQKIFRSTATKDAYILGQSTTEVTNRWVGNLIPSFKSEPFITGKANFVTKLEFELTGFRSSSSGYKVITPTYGELSKSILDRRDFGDAVKNSNFLRRPTEKVIANLNTDLQKLIAIHKHVSNKILWDGNLSYTPSTRLSKVYRVERGNSAEVNLILLGMLRQAGLNAQPVMLSTRANGTLHPVIAMIRKFNYVVTQVTIEGKSYIVDATDPLLPYNFLPFYALNGQGRTINLLDSRWVNLLNNEQDISSHKVDLEIDNDGYVLGKVEGSYGGYEAYSLRKFLKMESLKGYSDFISASYPNWEISNLKIDNYDNTLAFLNESYNIKIKGGTQSTNNGILFNPSLFVEFQENPFSNEERKFPIDFGCPQQATYVLNLKIPEGYIVDELPSSISLQIPNNGGSFFFKCEQVDNVISVQSRFNIKQVSFKAEDGKMLREFYAQIIRKQAELIVLKKKEA